MKIGITDAVAISRREQKMRAAELSERMMLSQSVSRRRILNPKTLRLEDFFRLGKIFGWTDAEMSDLLISTYHDLRAKKQL